MLERLNCVVLAFMRLNCNVVERRLNGLSYITGICKALSMQIHYQANAAVEKPQYIDEE